MRPFSDVVSFIEKPDLQTIHSINIGDGRDVKTGFCSRKFRKIYRHPFFNNFLKSLDGKAKVIMMLKNTIQQYQGINN